MRSSKSRTYTMRRRADQVDQTRLRITEATMRLHTTIGPASTTIAAVAQEADVTRLTVYRHFPDLDSLFFACSSHWRGLHPRPDLAAWTAIPDATERARVAIRELYAFYRANGADMVPIYRDIASMPQIVQDGIRAQSAATVDAIMGSTTASDPTIRLRRAIVGHFTSLWTWRSLTEHEGLTDEEATQMAVRSIRLDARDPR